MSSRGPNPPNGDHQTDPSRGESVAIRLTQAQRRDWLRLIRSDNIGPITFIELINRFGSASAALKHLPDLAHRGGARRTTKIATWESIDRELEAAKAQGIRFIALGESDYPPLLRHIDAAPPILSVIGNPGIFAHDCISIVGARNASIAGKKITGVLAGDLADRGFIIASGLARGIDAAAHHAALERGTVAVFAGGLNNVYPKENADLCAQILAKGGACVSEMPLTWAPRGRDFPRRNRIISGLSLATIVVEAAKRSGSLITARYALEQNRLVGAVPASPLDPRSGGVNSLIRDGAILVTKADDILVELSGAVASSIDNQDSRGVKELGTRGWGDDTGAYGGDLDDPLDPAPAPSERDILIHALGPTPVSVDDIIRQTGLPAQRVQMMILELDVAGRLERHGSQTLSLLTS